MAKLIETTSINGTDDKTNEDRDKHQSTGCRQQGRQQGSGDVINVVV